MKKPVKKYGSGSVFYVILITLVATLGGLLFGYDTAVVNGAEKSLAGLFISPALKPDNYDYAIKLITQYRILVAFVLYIIAVVISVQLIRLLGRKKGVISSLVLLILLSFLIILFFKKPLPQSNDITAISFSLDSIKGIVVASALVGCIIGAALAGFLAGSWGRKRGLIISAILFTISALGAWRPEEFNFFGSLDVFSFVIYRIAGGIGIGIASLLSPLYIAEIAPPDIRGKLVSLNQFAIITGMLIIFFVNYIIAGKGNEQWLIMEGWRWMFFSAVVPSIIFLILLFFIPETPRYLMMKGKESRALDVISRISGAEDAHKIQNEVRASLAEKRGTWLSCGLPVILIGTGLAVFQQFIGINVVLYYAGNIFRNLGASTNSSLLQTIIVGAINLTFTVIAIFTVDKYGRRPLMIVGAIVMSFSMFSLGFSFFLGLSGVAVLFFMLLFIAGFAMSWGPVTWVLLSEIFPNSIRDAMSLSVAALWIANLVVTWTFPILNDNLWLTEKFNHGFSYWIYGTISVMALFFVLKFIPETKGKSLEGIEKHWKKDHSALVN